MGKRYGKGRRQCKRASKQRQKAARQEVKQQVCQSLQLSLDRQEVVELMQDSLDRFAIEVGRLVAVGLLDDEIEQLCGPKHEWGQTDRTATRYGRQPGYVSIGGQKVRIDRPRVRSTQGRGELTLERYQQLQRPDALPEAFLRRMVRGVSTRDYDGVIDLAQEGFGVQKSSVSRGFVRAMPQVYRSGPHAAWLACGSRRYSSTAWNTRAKRCW